MRAKQYQFLSLIDAGIYCTNLITFIAVCRAKKEFKVNFACNMLHFQCSQFCRANFTCWHTFQFSNFRCYFGCKHRILLLITINQRSHFANKILSGKKYWPKFVTKHTKKMYYKFIRMFFELLKDDKYIALDKNHPRN